jgi:aryl-alcohol dehydrogenase-like predicted oxidoreductase
MFFMTQRPLARKDGQPYDKNLTENPYPTWQKLEELVEKGKVRNIGVSKYVFIYRMSYKLFNSVLR